MSVFFRPYVSILVRQAPYSFLLAIYWLNRENTTYSNITWEIVILTKNLFFRLSFNAWLFVIDCYNKPCSFVIYLCFWILIIGPTTITDGPVKASLSNPLRQNLNTTLQQNLCPLLNLYFAGFSPGSD